MSTLGLVDTHVHLHSYANIDGLLSRAAAVGVRQVVAIGVDLATSHWNVELARGRNDVVAAVGVHPVEVRSPVGIESLAELTRLASEPSVGFIGEIGVDTQNGPTDLTTQLDALATMLALASQVRKPVNLHLVGAVDEALAVVRERFPVDRGAICHYFTGDWKDAFRLLDAGLLISVGKPITRPANWALRAAIRAIPLDRLLLETDTYPLPGRTTEPADLVGVAQAVADVRQCPVDAIIAATTELFERITQRA